MNTYFSVARNLIQSGLSYYDKHAMVQAMTGYEFSMQCLKVLNPAWLMSFTCDRSIQAPSQTNPDMPAGLMDECYERCGLEKEPVT